MDNIENIIYNNVLSDKIDHAVERKIIVFLSGLLCCGKSTVAKIWASKHRKRIHILELDNTFTKEKLDEYEFVSNSMYIIENIHTLYNNDDVIGHLSMKIEKSAKKSRFILTGRCTIPPCFKCMELEDKLCCLGLNDIVFSYDMLTGYCNEQKLKLSKMEIHYLLKWSFGHPLFIKTVFRNIKNNENDIKRLCFQAEEDLYTYFDVKLFSLMNETEQKCLLYTASCFECNKEIISLISDSDYKVYNNIMQKTSLAANDIKGQGSVIPIFRRYFMKKQRELLDTDAIKEINEKLSEYYFNKNSIKKAVYYEKLAGNNNKIAYILEKNSLENHVGLVDYYDLEEYYLSLNEEMVLQSPALLSGLSMIHSLCGRIDESEKRAGQLEKLLTNEKNNSEAYNKILGCVLYLNMALPHRGNRHMIKSIVDTSKIVTDYGLNIQNMSITGNMPGVISGEKDLCNWSKNDMFLYKVMKKPIEILFGKSGQGLVEIGFGEFAYERNNFEKAVEYLSIGLTKSEISETCELYFAGQAIMFKYLIAEGKSKSAESLIQNVDKKLINLNAGHLLPNMYAFNVKQGMNVAHPIIARRWMQKQLEKENKRFYYTRRYEYLLMIRIWIMEGDYSQALLLTERILVYACINHRKYIEMEATLLKCLILFRMKNESYVELLKELVDELEKYKFVRIVADEGAAVYDMLNSIMIKSDFYNVLLEAVKRQKMLYPNYLQNLNYSKSVLTDKEIIILKYLSKGLKNAEIADILAVTTYAVKYHLVNIYEKLGVDNRSSAVKVVAEHEWIF